MPAPNPRDGGSPGWGMAGRGAEGWREEGQILPSSSVLSQCCIGAPFPSCFGAGHPPGLQRWLLWAIGVEQPQGCCTAPPAAAPALNPPAITPGSPTLAMAGDGPASCFPDFPHQARVIYDPHVFKLNIN